MLRDNETPSQTPYFIEIVQNTRMFNIFEHAGILNTPPTPKCYNEMRRILPVFNEDSR